jgi:hypothetical protein
MNDTRIKTRHGIILEGVIGAALTAAGYKYEADVQYDPSCEKPDFLIPNAVTPRFMVEVHQTDTRDSLRMKTLRAFVAVTEAKAHFGAGLISVNVVFGDPDEDFSSSPLSAISAIYDLSIFPARDKSARKALQKIEKASLNLSSDSEYSTQQAIEVVCGANSPAIGVFGRMLKAELSGASARAELVPLWQAERKRQNALVNFPKAGPATYYKRMMLGALFFTDEQFDELVAGAAKNEWPSEVVKQLIRVGFATVSEEIDGDNVVVQPEFRSFLKDSRAPHLRRLCREVLDSVPDMHWYFEDIRDEPRRMRMARNFLAALSGGKTALERELVESLSVDKHKDIEHARGWFLDLCSIVSNKSFNFYNKAIFQDPRYPLSLWNAFSNLAIRSPALVGHPDRLKTLSKIVAEKVFHALSENGISAKSVAAADIAEGLLQFRVNSAIKLRKLNPLVVVVAAIAADYGLRIERPNIDTLLFDLARDAGVGRFLVFVLTDPRTEKRVLLGVVAVHDGHGDDKSKEWGARRIASLYRFVGGEVESSEFDQGLFVLDGEWEDKDVSRLYRCGWNHICRLGEVEDTLKAIFGLKGKVKGSKAKRQLMSLEESDEDT